MFQVYTGVLFVAEYRFLFDISHSQNKMTALCKDKIDEGCMLYIYNFDNIILSVFQNQDIPEEVQMLSAFRFEPTLRSPNAQCFKI